MKELTTEQKVKAYDKALSVARKTHQTQPMYRDWLEKMFPELAESEDERIRKFLIKEVMGHIGVLDIEGDKIVNNTKNELWSKALAWLEAQGEPIEINPSEFDSQLNRLLKQFKSLPKEDLESSLSFYLNVVQNDGSYKEEKQGEQKPANNVEPEFKIGDWVVVDGVTQQVTQIRPEGFETDKAWNGKLTFKDVHLWTIQDAKNGDVLATPDYILIFKEFFKNDGGISYCLYDFGARNPQFIWSEDRNWYFGKEAIVHPATNEQRDTLMKAMADAGYTFDFEKRELKKIEQKPAWSEEDEKMIEHICYALPRMANGNIKILPSVAEEYVERLKSLRPQSQWKPSDEQMRELGIVATGKGWFSKEILSELLEQLKKLRGE